RGDLRNIEQLGRAIAACGERIAEHGVAEGAGGSDGFRAGGNQLGGADVADALALFFAQKRQPAPGPAAEAALVVALGFNQPAGAGSDRPRLFINVAVAAEITRIVKDDLPGGL